MVLEKVSEPYPLLGKEHIECPLLLDAEFEVETLDDTTLTGSRHLRGQEWLVIGRVEELP